MDVRPLEDAVGFELVPVSEVDGAQDSRDVVWANRVIDHLRETPSGAAVFNGTRAAGNVALNPWQSQVFYAEAKRQAEEVAAQSGSNPNLPDDPEKVNDAVMVVVRHFSERYSPR